jgi:CHASE1-domain containing sensor protein
MKASLPVLAFLAVALIGSAGSAIVWVIGERAERTDFEAIAEDAVNRIQARMSRYMLLLDATAAYFEAEMGDVSVQEFSRFVEHLDLALRHDGIATLGFAPLMEERDREAVMQVFRENYDTTLPLLPETAPYDFAAPVAFVETTDAERPRLIGYDMYSEPARRAAMEAAAKLRAPQASGPVRLVGDRPGGQQAFIVFAPLYVGVFGVEERIDRPQVPTGYVFAGFRSGSLIDAALRIPPILPIHMMAHDAASPAGTLMHSYGDAPSQRLGAGYRVERTIDVAGREWALVFRPTDAYRPSGTQRLALVLGVVSLLFAAALAALLRAQNRAHAATELLAQTMEQNLVEKDLMLQEMKHRIKNSIARILAMARQTAARATGVEAFTESFTQRLQAMATAQDMLTRSRYQRADLRELLLQELGQVFGSEDASVRLEGPPASLDEAATQALGLTFHELATNALKYGGTSEKGPAIEVRWSLEGEGAERRLVLVWQESGACGLSAPSKVGFGTRLIDTNVRVELRGDIRREFLPHGLRIDIAIPLVARQAHLPRADLVRQADAGATSCKAMACRSVKPEPRGARPAD